MGCPHAEEDIYLDESCTENEITQKYNDWDSFPIGLKPKRNRSGTVSSVSTSSSRRPKNYFCDYKDCNKAFTRPSLLTEHQQTVHQGLKRFECNRCQKSFSRKTHLERHLLSHLTNEEKPFHCSICNKGVITQQQLNRHEITHTKSFSCPYNNCQEAFYKHPQLRSHILSVHLEKLVCKHCSKNFQRPYRLENHIKKHHNPDVVTPYNCSFPNCLRSFKTWTQLTLHTKNDHPKLQCNICNKFLVGETGLKMHMKIHDDTLVTRNWKCSLCKTPKRSFPKKQTLIDHYKEEHSDSPIPTELQLASYDNKQPSLNNESETFDRDILPSQKKPKLNNKTPEPFQDIQNEILIEKYLKQPSSADDRKPKVQNFAMELILNTVGRKLKCPYDKCYRTFKTKEKYDIHINKHKIHELKLKILEEQK